MRTSVLALLAVLIPATAASGSLQGTPLEALRARLMDEPGYAGVFGIATGGDVAVDSLGEARPGVKHVPGQAVRWASVSKMITAILVFQQIEVGRLALDAPVSTYLPGSTLPNSERITIRQLLAHRSGLGQQADFGPGAPRSPVLYCNEAVAEPGSTFAYNNCDTIVLGEVLETVTGMPLVSLANESIGTPLGVSLTIPETGRVEATMADGTDEPEVWPSGYGAAGGLYGSIEGLLKIDMALMQGKLISAGSLATMIEGDPASGFAALSVWSYEPDLGSCLGKTRLVERYGEIGGVQVRNFLLPDRNLALAIYSNDHRTGFGEVWRGEGLSIDLIRAAACGTVDRRPAVS